MSTTDQEWIRESPLAKDRRSNHRATPPITSHEPVILFLDRVYRNCRHHGTVYKLKMNRGNAQLELRIVVCNGREFVLGICSVLFFPFCFVYIRPKFICLCSEQSLSRIFFMHTAPPAHSTCNKVPTQSTGPVGGVSLCMSLRHQ